MKKVEILEELARGNVVVVDETLYKDDKIYRKVNEDSEVLELLKEYEKNRAIFIATDKYIIYDLYNCYIIEDNFEEYKELEIDFIRPDGDYANVGTYLLHEGVWYCLEN
jgi:predicted house-cleaning NTP pyrophosphatase (Maf/HAM1 superfamily)